MISVKLLSDNTLQLTATYKPNKKDGDDGQGDRKEVLTSQASLNTSPTLFTRRASS